METNKQLTVVEKIDAQVRQYLETETMNGFAKAHSTAVAMQQLNTMLNEEYMKPIMLLAGSRLGFKVDRAYQPNVIKQCLIEAVLKGVQPFGNQFNILAGNCYITKEGLGYLLKNYKGLHYKLKHALPKVSQDKKSAAVSSTITWSIDGGQQQVETVEIPIKVNNGMSVDAVLGKATRKARAWLYEHLTGNDVGDGDVESIQDGDIILKDANGKEIKQPTQDEKETTRVLETISQATQISELQEIEDMLVTEEKFTDAMANAIANAKQSIIDKEMEA